MKKLLIILVFAAHAATAQQAKEVVKAEMDFARLALDSGMKKAFLAFLDSNGVVFSRGAIHNGLRQWNAAPDIPGKLLWHPVFAGIAASGDIGFTTGPFEFRATLQDSVNGSGQYSTVWHKTKQGEWKALADLGIDYTPSLLHHQPMQYTAGFTPAADTGIMQTELAFIQQFASDSVQAFLPILHPDAWLNINGQLPARGKDAIASVLTKIPGRLVFIPAGSGMAASRDLAYVYGVVQYNGRKENYLRAWAHTASGWKLLLQVLRW